MKLTTKTIIPHSPGVYSAFPTLIGYGDRLFLFYRQGRASTTQMHGLEGAVRCFQIPLSRLNEGLCSSNEVLYSLGVDERLPFHSPNELDAIASRPADNLFTLATRTYMASQTNQPFISFSSEPVFHTRTPVDIPELNWMVFYGQALTSAEGIIFPAYGSLKTDNIPRPLILVSRDRQSLNLLATLSSGLNGEVILNEHSIVHDGSRYISFIRQDSPPFGLWLSESVNLLTWSAPRQFCAQAHAPMALTVNGLVYLAWRDLSAAGQTRIRLCTPFVTDGLDVILDTYDGNPYDGGYTSLYAIDNHLLVAYYLGNEQGEPFIRMAAVEM